MGELGDGSGRKEKARPAETAPGSQSGIGKEPDFNPDGIKPETAAAKIQQSLPSKKEPGWSLSSRIQFETFEHESKNLIPIFEYEIAQQGFQILKKGSASAQSLANGAVLFIHQI